MYLPDIAMLQYKKFIGKNELCWQHDTAIQLVKLFGESCEHKQHSLLCDSETTDFLKVPLN